jgi:hypothetical protein
MALRRAGVSFFERALPPFLPHCRKTAKSDSMPISLCLGGKQVKYVSDALCGFFARSSYVSVLGPEDFVVLFADNDRVW